MNFRPELCAKVLSGEKTVTRRPVSANPRSPWYAEGCKLKLGKDYAVCPGRGKTQVGRIRVLDVRAEVVGQITNEDARREGLDDREHFIAVWMELYGEWKPLTPVWRIEFELIQETAADA